MGRSWLREIMTKREWKWLKKGMEMVETNINIYIDTYCSLS